MADYFTAVDRDDPERAERIDEERADPAQDAFQPLINGAGPDYAIAQLRGIDAMASTQRRVLSATLVAVPIGAALYLLVLALFAAQRRRADSAVQAELGTLRAALREGHLTGLRNHRALHEDLALAGAAQAGAHALALVDLVDLKAYNDLEGYVMGDERLRAFARATRDAVAGRGRCYRLGGDDFVVLLPDHGALSALALLDEIRAALAAAGHGAVRVGVAEGSLESGSTELLRRGDVALAAARRTGRPAVVYATDLELDVGGDASGEDEALTALTTALAQAVDAKDPYTRSHCETVSAVAALVAEQLGLPPERVARVRLAGLMHDVGKIGIPDAILNKPGKLDATEWEIMRSRAALGRDILSAAGLEEEAEWVLHHHERVDGGGYPDGLAGDAVPLKSRIILTADTFEAITSDRSYRRGRSEAEVLAELRRHAGTQFDPACVASLEAVLAARPAVVEPVLVAAGAV